MQELANLKVSRKVWVFDLAQPIQPLLAVAKE